MIGGGTISVEKYWGATREAAESPVNKDNNPLTTKEFGSNKDPSVTRESKSPSWSKSESGMSAENKLIRIKIEMRIGRRLLFLCMFNTLLK